MLAKQCHNAIGSRAGQQGAVAEAVVCAWQATNPYLAGMPQVGSTFSPYFTPGPVMPAILGPDPASVASPLSVVPQTVVAQQKMPRSDRLEPVSVATVGAVELGKKRPRDPSDDILLMDMKSVGSFYYDSFAFPGMVPYKRPAADKSGMPVYQPSATTYQQLMQPFVPVSCEYSTPCATATSSSASPATLGDEAPVPATTEPDKLPPASSEQGKVAVNPVLALSYTGVTLNKQAVAAAAAPPPPQARFPTPTLSYHPHAGLLAYGRPANPAAFMSPYQFVRPQFVQAPYAMMPQAPSHVLPNGLLAGMMSPYATMTSAMPTSTPTTNNAATTNNNNNNSIVSSSVALQPYKKMKTT